ncbi:TPA: hypothetical protein ACPSKB_003237 [Legionella feeleii]
MIFELLKVTIATLSKTLDGFNAYIKGGSTFKDLKARMKFYDNKLVKLNTDFHTITISDSEEDSSPEYKEIIKKLKALLTNLNIPQSHWDRYLKSSLTVYDFFAELKKEKNMLQAGDILDLIDEKTAYGKMELAVGGALILSILANLYMTPVMAGTIDVIKGFLASATGIPILGAVYTGFAAVYAMYQNHFDKKRSLFNRIRDNAFLFTNTAINIAAYAIWIASATVMSPIVASLFVAASAVDVFKEMFAAAQNYLEYRNSPPIVGNDLQAEQELLRRESNYIKHRNAAIVNLVAAVVLVGIMAAWCFVPGGIFVTLAAVAAIVTVYAVKTAILKYNESTMRDRLQTGLKTLEETHEEKAEVEAGDDLDMSPHHEISTGLTQVLTHTVDSTLTTVTVSRSDNNEEPSKLHVSGGSSFFNHEHGHHETTTPASDVKSKKDGEIPPSSIPTTN